MSKKPKSIIAGVLVLLLIAVPFGWWWQSNARHGKYKDLIKAFYVIGIVKLNYYQPVNLGKLVKSYFKTGNIAGMLKTLHDPYTEFLDKAEYAELQKETKGVFGGIGIYLIPKAGELIISSVVKGSPGEKAGLRQGDRIIQVNHISVKNLSSEGAIAHIKGKAGTKVILRIARGEGSNRTDLDVEIVRSNIVIPTVDMTLTSDPILGRYAMLKIEQFSETTVDELEKKLKQLDQMTDCKGLILDLRGNPGGLLTAAVNVVSQFLPEGTPVLYVYNKGKLLQTIVSEYSAHKYLPMIVLIDNWSASAAEIVSGALKDQKRAVVVGAHSYGKDLIQEVKDLWDGTAVKVTIANYLTSGKVNIHKKGVQPDNVVDIPGAMDALLKKGNTEPFIRMKRLQEEEALRILREQPLKEIRKKAG